MNRLTDVVKHLLAINVIVYLIAVVFFEREQYLTFLALFFPSSDYFQGHQLVTHMFMHGGPAHLFFNMMLLFFLGPHVEQALGHKKFLFLYLFSGVGAFLLHFVMIVVLGNLGINVPVVGASGALYGVLVVFALLYPNVKLMLLIPPIPVKAKVLVPILIAIDLFGGFGVASSPIAHFAHLGGALFGFLAFTYWRMRSAS